MRGLFFVWVLVDVRYRASAVFSPTLFSFAVVFIVASTF